MMRFIYKLVILFSPILLLLGLIEHRLASVPSGYRTKRAYLERSIANTQVIITGSSHAYFGIKPLMLGVPAFNIAYVNQDPYYDSRITLKYLTKAKSAKLVIVTISYFTLENPLLEDSAEPWRTSYYYEFWDIPTAHSGIKVGDYSFIGLYGIPQARHFLWQGAPDSLGEHIDESGGNADLRSTNVASVTDAHATLERHNSNLKDKHITQNRQYLVELFEALRDRGIRAVMVTTPCFRSYYENLNPEVYASMQHEIRNLRQAYAVEYYNYLTDSRFTIDDFADSDHLSTSGAEKFSVILRDEVVKKYIK